MQRTIGAQIQDEQLVSERRQKIILAAIKVFREKGFHQATTKDVAVAAGTTQSNLYNYVRTKDDILYLVCEHLVGLYDEGVEQVVANFEDPYDRLVHAVRAVTKVMYTHREELLLLYNETHALEKPDRRLILKAVSRFTSRFQDLLVAYEAAFGQTRIANKRVAANLLSFVPALVALRGWDLSLHATRDEVENGIFDFIIGGLGIAARP
ncbi:MAG TPA: TetR/AcrR family transcriptional regulator [Rhizobiaceae bacterium]|nr:TetR/AcrR family transcriptional regulator [Rhizobiaceae bacterium]